MAAGNHTQSAGEAVAIAKEWIELYGSQIPGFCGAHLMGSLSTMPADAPFPAFGDVDFNIITREAKMSEPIDVFYKGFSLEYSIYPITEYQSAETVLANPVLACHLAAPSSLADPQGILSELYPAVAAGYAQRKWVQARCAWEKKSVLDQLDLAARTSSPFELISGISFTVINLAGLLVVAQVKPPTTRRSLIQLHNLLQEACQLDLHERALKILGHDQLDRAEVESCLQQAADAFDHAVEVHRSPTPLSHKLKAYVRPYLIDGSQQMIDEGFHREAMVLVAGTYLISLVAILTDGTPADQQKYFPEVQSLLGYFGLTEPESVPPRIEQAKALASDLFALADSWVEQDAEIVN